MPPPSLFPLKMLPCQRKIYSQLKSDHKISSKHVSKMHESGAGPPQTPLPSFSSLANADLTFQRKVTLCQVTWGHAAGTMGRKLHQNNKILFLEPCRQLTEKLEYGINRQIQHINNTECSEFIFIPSSFPNRVGRARKCQWD